MKENLRSLSLATAGTSNEGEWNRFIDNHPEASLYHSFAWRRVVREAYGQACHYLFARDASGEWRATLPLVHLKGPLAPNRLVSIPYLDRGGILASSAEASDFILARAFALCRKLGANGVDLRGVADATPARHHQRFRLVLELGESEEKLWQTVGPKVRNQIRKADTAGLETRPVPTRDLGAFYKVFSRNMRDLGAPVHSIRFLRQVLLEFKSKAELYLTYDKAEKPVAGAILLRFRDVASVPWASSLRSARSACPNHSLYWRVLRDAQTAGAERLDFGSSFEGSGTYRFMKQWGATPIPLTWRCYDPDGRLHTERRITAGNHGRLVRLWRRLPTPVANRLGPLVRRQIAN